MKEKRKFPLPLPEGHRSYWMTKDMQESLKKKDGLFESIEKLKADVREIFREDEY